MRAMKAVKTTKTTKTKSEQDMQSRQGRVMIAVMIALAVTAASYFVVWTLIGMAL